MAAREPVKNWKGQVIAFLETDNKGNVLVKDFYGRLQGRYDAYTNTTKDFYGRVIARGNQVGMLIKDN